MNEVYLLTGGNMGNRRLFLEKAAAAVGRKIGSIARASSIYQTAAWGMEDQASFLNQVLEVHTSLEAPAVLQQILEIETGLGRKRDKRYGPRTIDIDILLFNDLVLQLPGLTLPHPRMQERRFVLEPLSELIPDRMHPVLKKTISRLLTDCTDPLPVNKIN
jgi:2-amino-4-hydroxy-6-hydroxymethyldihydropteridine diphosphokinase